MALPNVDLSAVTAAIDRAKTVQASAVALINGFKDQVTAAVTKALTEDDAADQGSIDAAVAAINSTAADLNASSDALGTAITNNTPSA